MGDFQLDCSFCDEVIESESVEAVKDRGSSHLEDRHDTQLLTVFTGKHGIDECRDCGSAFRTDGGGVEKLECSDCGHDNFQPLVRRYLYWQIEAD